MPSALPDRDRASSRALFLDRDGVINRDDGYVHTPDQFIFNDGIFDLCRMALQSDFKLVIITNQSGIGRGYFTEADFQQLTQWMLACFQAQHLYITHVYYCPHYSRSPKAIYRQNAKDRKPAPGMLLKAQQAHALKMSDSLLIGDKVSDIQAGKAAGVGTNILLNAELNCTEADLQFPDLENLNHWFKKQFLYTP